MRATRLDNGLSIDGKLNEPAWATAVPSGDFMQSYPKVGAKPTDPTEVRVLYDDDAIYVGVRMFDSRPDSIAAQLARSRDLIAEFEHNPTTVCANSLAGVRARLEKMVDTLSLIDLKPAIAGSRPDVAPTTVVVPAPAKK